MDLCKKGIFYIALTLVCFSSFSGCILEDLFFPTNFSISSYDICDDEGFPGLNVGFSNTGTVTVKLYSPYNSMLDSDFFFKGNHDAIFHLSSYKGTAEQGQYRLVAFDKNGNNVFEQTFSFSGSDLSIVSCDQKWWKRGAWKGGYSLIGLNLWLYNNGDTPVYPYTVEVVIDSETITGFVLPSVVLPNESKFIDCFVYKDETPTDSTFSVLLKDCSGSTLVTDTFSVVLEDNVPVKDYTWRYKGLSRRLRIPYPEFLFDYYSGIERIKDEDYGVYVFDPYDTDYIEIVVDQLMLGFPEESDVDKINFAASFVQNLEYKFDSETNESFEYPRFPVETVFNGEGGGDCEDLSILCACILDHMGYDVALLRLPDHMAVGVHLDEDDLPGYDYYTGNYYFLETTSAVSCGPIPEDYKSPSELTIYPISSRPLLLHSWKNNALTIFTNTEIGDFVKVKLIVENLGAETAENILVEGFFITQVGLVPKAESEIISFLKPGMKKEIILTVDIPLGVTTWFKTRIYLEGKVVDEKESASSFP